MFIDGHAHACGVFSSAEKIVEYLDANNIDMVVLCAGEANSERNYKKPVYPNASFMQKLVFFFKNIIMSIKKTRILPENLDEQNKFVYKLSKKLPTRVINSYWVNPLDEDCIEKLDEFYPRYKFKMIKLHQFLAPFDIRSEKCKAVFMWAEKHNIPVFIHLRSKDQAAGFVDTANKFQNLSLIVGHMIGLDYINTNIISTNVYYDLSSPQLYSMGMLRRAFSKEGAERLILGSDMPYGIDNLAKVMARLKKLNLSDEQMSFICGENLYQLLDLNRKYEFIEKPENNDI